MTRTFYDAITPANIPVTAQGVCGYVDGRYAWSAADWARFPHSVKARIAVFSSTNDGHILDVEAGCSTPANAPGWVVRRRAAGIDPTVYCSLSAWPTVKTAFHNAGVTEPHWWIAAYPGNGANLYPGSVAHQWQNPGPVDISVVADYWPGVDPASNPVTVEPRSPAKVKAVQAVVRDRVTGFFGTDLGIIVTALKNAQSGSFPHGVKFAQWHCFTAMDGSWGPQSKAALTTTIGLLQNRLSNAPTTLTLTSDGVWGDRTQIAWNAFYAGNHLQK